MDSKRQPDGGFQLNYSINNHKMEVRILRSQEYMTVIFMVSFTKTTEKVFMLLSLFILNSF